MALDALVGGDRAKATIGWTVAVVLTVAVAVSLVTNDPLWAGFSLVVALVVVLPAVATRDPTSMAPWPLLAVAAVAVSSRVAGVYTEPAGYVAVATLALVIVVELDVFTPIELSRRFAIAFAVLTTMAVEALWIIAQFLSDWWLGTGFLSTQTQLQEDIVVVTVVGLSMGGLFYWFFERADPAGGIDGSSEWGESP